MGLKLTTEEKDDTIAAKDMKPGAIGVVLESGTLVIRPSLATNADLVSLVCGSVFFNARNLRVRLLKPGTTLTVC